MSHQEFPELTSEARQALTAGYRAAFPWLDGHKKIYWIESNRKGQAAFLREVMRQATGSYGIVNCKKLRAIADNLHSPPPPPPAPTLAEARKADLDTPAGKDVVRDFLAALGEGVQP